MPICLEIDLDQSSSRIPNSKATTRRQLVVAPGREPRKQFRDDGPDFDAGWERRRAHCRLRFANGEAITDSEAHADVVNRVAGLKLAAEMVALHEGFAVHEPGLYLPQSIVAEVGIAFDRAPVHQAPLFATILIDMWQLLLPLPLKLLGTGF